MGLGDVVSQLCVEKKTVREFEWLRTATFFSMGTIMVVSFHYDLHIQWKGIMFSCSSSSFFICLKIFAYLEEL